MNKNNPFSKYKDYKEKRTNKSLYLLLQNIILGIVEYQHLRKLFTSYLHVNLKVI